MRKITITEKNWMMSFISAVIVSFMIYYSNHNSIYTRLDLYILEAGICAPFLFPLYMFIYYRLWEVHET